MKRKRLFTISALIVLSAAVLMLVRREGEPVSAVRFVEPDKLYEILDSNIQNEPGFEVIAEIDHARLAVDVGSPMPPSHVLIWSVPELEAAILKHNPVAAVDLPLRVLAFEDPETGKAAVITNSYAYLSQRHSLPEDETLRADYDAAIEKAIEGIPEEAIGRFASDTMPDTGLINLESPYDFETTERRVLEAINAQSDTVGFGNIDFADRSKKYGVPLNPMRLILFGAPGPGGKAMASAPTLGLDAFCQKLLIWEDGDGTVRVTLNDLLALAERQQVSGGLPLRVINRRLKDTFSTALKQ